MEIGSNLVGFDNSLNDNYVDDNLIYNTVCILVEGYIVFTEPCSDFSFLGATFFSSFCSSFFWR